MFNGSSGVVDHDVDRSRAERCTDGAGERLPRRRVAGARFGVADYPTLVWLSPDGSLRDRVVGVLGATELGALMEEQDVVVSC